jgi:O-antigen/teichoic acid export membrane protein
MKVIQISKFHLAQRFLMAISGSAGVALSSFVVAALLLKTIPPAQFGIYSFIQVIIALGYGISNALFGSPLLVALNRTDYPLAGTAESYFKANFWISLVASFPIWAIVIYLGGSQTISLSFALSAMLMWTRWFGRSYANAIHEPLRAAVSDACYTVIVLVGATLLFGTDILTLKTVPLLQACGAGLSILSLGRKSLVVQFVGIWRGTLTAFRAGFRDQGRHALVGVITTEGTANAHSYMITLLLGPAAFAPLAASLLLFRPVPLVLLSLTQLERPRISRLLRDKQNRAAWHAIRAFRIAALGFWGANILIAYVVVIFFLEIVIRADYNPRIIIQATLFWCVIMGLRCLRGPESALVQANGNFRGLARVTMVSCLVSLPVVFGMVYFIGAVWSLGGVLMGEIVALILIAKLARRAIPTEDSLG